MLKTLYKRSRWLLFLIVSSAALYAQVYLVEALADGDISVSSFLVLHLGVVALIGLWVLMERVIGCDLRLSLLFTIMVFVSGPFGALMSLLMWLFYLIFVRTAHVFSEWFESLFPEEEKNYGERIYERVAYGLDDFSGKANLVPFHDVILFGNEHQKRQVIGEISRHFRPEFVPTLREAIRSKNNGIRVQAANVLTKHDQTFVHKLMEVEAKYEQTKEDYLLLKIARLCRLYAASGLPDEGHRRQLYDKAIEYYESYLQTEPHNAHEVKHILGGLYLKHGQAQKAYDYLRDYEEVEIGERHISEPSLLWYMEALFCLKKYRQLHEIADRCLPKFNEHQRIVSNALQYMMLWGSQAH